MHKSAYTKSSRKFAKLIGYMYSWKAVHLSVCMSITPIPRLELQVLTHQVPNAKLLSSAYFKFVMTAFSFFSVDKEEEKTGSTFHSTNSSLRCTTDLHSRGHGFKSRWWTGNSTLIALLFGIPSMHWQDLSEIKRTLSGNSNMFILHSVCELSFWH